MCDDYLRKGQRAGACCWRCRPSQRLSTPSKTRQINTNNTNNPSSFLGNCYTMDNFNVATAAAGVLALLCLFLITRRKTTKTPPLSSEESDRNRQASQQNRKPVWMKRVDGDSNWVYLTDDVMEIDHAYNGVKSGVVMPASSPHSVVLSSGRTLTFDWESDPSTFTNAISNIRCIGRTQSCTLERR